MGSSIGFDLGFYMVLVSGSTKCCWFSLFFFCWGGVKLLISRGPRFGFSSLCTGVIGVVGTVGVVGAIDEIGVNEVFVVIGVNSIRLQLG